MRKIPEAKVVELLDRISKGGSLQRIANEVDVAKSTVFNFMRDNPLWKYAHDKSQ